MFNSWILSSLVVVIPTVLVCLLILWIVRKKVSTKKLQKHHDVAGFTFSIVGVLYSVILGFTVINVQQRYNAAEESIHTEATMLIDLSRDARIFPEENRAEIQSLLKEYIIYVIREEWGSIDIHLKAQDLFRRIWDAYYRIDLSSEKIALWYQASIEKLDRLMNARLSREYSSWDRLSNMMWSLLIIGALITVGFMFFFGLDDMRMQMLMTALLSGYLSFMLFLVFTLDHVFLEPEGVKPIAFEKILPLFL